VLQGCYCGITVVLPCYKGVTVVLQWCLDLTVLHFPSLILLSSAVMVLESNGYGVGR
jgi:hypothetical protein